MLMHWVVWWGAMEQSLRSFIQQRWYLNDVYRCSIKKHIDNYIIENFKQSLRHTDSSKKWVTTKTHQPGAIIRYTLLQWVRCCCGKVRLWDVKSMTWQSSICFGEKLVSVDVVNCFFCVLHWRRVEWRQRGPRNTADLEKTAFCCRGCAFQTNVFLAVCWRDGKIWRDEKGILNSCLVPSNLQEVLFQREPWLRHCTILVK